MDPSSGRGIPSIRSDAPIVRIAGVSKQFPIRRGWADTLLHPTRIDYQSALEDIRLEVRRGEIFGLLGQNGAGKTTLFKILATLVLPDVGTAEVDGLDVVRQSAEVRKILTPVIPNERSLYWRLSARENLRLYATLHGVPHREVGRVVAEMLKVVSLDDTGDKLVGLFSSGMKQRLLVARALLCRPRVLLLDEPTRSMDPISARDFRAFVRDEIAGRHGCTILLATHDHEEVTDLCQRVGILEKGRLLAVGATEDLVRELQVHRYRIWTDTPDHPAIESLTADWQVSRMQVEGRTGDGWVRIGLDLPEGPQRAAALLGHLTSAGVSVSRFEKVELPLADLIERAAALQIGNEGARPDTPSRPNAGAGEPTSGRRGPTR